MQKQDWQLLLFLALQAGLRGKAKTSTAKIALSFATSQQTASRKLRQLAKRSLITLSATPNGCSVSLTEQGIALLKENFLSLQQLFEGKRKTRLSGRVKIGLGEGRYYVSRPFYLKQFKSLLGSKPFLGTLNLIVEPAELSSFLSGLQSIEIKGFKTEERSFGKIQAFKVLVEGKQKGAIIFPERTAHPKNEIEVISQVNMRKKFNLREGSRVFLSVE